MKIDKERAEQAFRAHVAAYDPTDPKIALKIDHTFRVAALAERIARSLVPSGRSGDPAGRAAGAPCMPAEAASASVPAAAPASDGPAYVACDEDVDLAWLLGLLHDIGRFEQVRRWGTFDDGKSVGHAQLGTQILFAGAEGDAPLVRSFVASDAEDDLIRMAVGLHSAWRLPGDLDGRTRCFCEVLRDADKVDILKVNGIDSVESIYGFRTRAARQPAFQRGALVVRPTFHHPPGTRRYPADVPARSCVLRLGARLPGKPAHPGGAGLRVPNDGAPLPRPETRAAFARRKQSSKLGSPTKAPAQPRTANAIRPPRE